MEFLTAVINALPALLMIVFVLYAILGAAAERRRDPRYIVRTMHRLCVNEADTLVSLPHLRDTAIRRNSYTPTIVAANTRCTVLYWNTAYYGRLEEEHVRVGDAPVVTKESWRLMITWRTDTATNTWLLAELRVDGRLQLLPMPSNWFKENWMLADMLRAVKAAKPEPEEGMNRKEA